ncbi:hypothetical protein [Halomonas caseinilytica]|uniref:hypothetical protein n=1 Tax=Halomonas caseinilytica TaxID=438744 RepID=UPI0009F60474|nr:hypothetical protein [Halomonas caseinilytica]
MNPGKNYKLSDYSDRIKKTDSLGKELEPIALGLFGEVGSILSSGKKLKREGKEVYDFGDSINEELGDALWYFCRLVDIMGYTTDELVPGEVGINQTFSLLATNIPCSPLAQLPVYDKKDIWETLPKLGKCAADLLDLPEGKEERKILLKSFLSRYLDTVKAAQVSFSSVIENNLIKTEGRFLPINYDQLPEFDGGFEEDERLPDNFKIEVRLKGNGKTYMKWRGVFIGDPLTDNIREKDYYRFHDVFHMANAAILHWSPTFRALIKHKRKSDPLVDEQQDSGRAIVIEEGLTAWIFSVAKEKNLFEGHEKLSFGMLKNIQKFVKGYEVELCPASLWEKAILEGYEVFRQLVKYKSGFVVGDKEKRTISFEPYEDKHDS